MIKRFIIKPESRHHIAHSVHQWLLAQADEHLPLEVSIKPYKRNRSTEQNALYWSLLSVISQETGYTKDDLHDMLRNKFLGMQVKEIAGEQVQYLPSTTKLKVGEMADYITQIEAWSAQLGIRLPAWER